MFSAVHRVLRTLHMRAFNRSDYERWRNPNSLESWWESRAKQIAAFTPKGTRVIEFGAGHRWLERYLDASCNYIPSDLVGRGPGTIICDQNQRPLPNLRCLRLDVAVFIGVLEYAKDVSSVNSLAVRASRFVHGIVRLRIQQARYVRRFIESLRRAYYGYMNTYAEAEFVAIFAQCGFICTCIETWSDQRLFLFQNVATSPL